MALLARLAILAVVVTTLLMAGCGQDTRSSGQSGALEDSVKSALRERLREGGAFSQVLEVRCRPEGERADQRCTAIVRARAFVFNEGYQVVVGPDGCWTGRRTSMEVLRGGVLELELPEGELKGCLP